jgi:hypothetical protein
MNKEVKLWERYSLDSLLTGSRSVDGRLFLSELGQVDMSGFQVLHSGLDTVRQLYTGTLKVDVLDRVSRMFSEGLTLPLTFASHSGVHILACCACRFCQSFSNCIGLR